MIAAAALCPCPPLLLRELTGQEEALPELRAACAAAVARLIAAGPHAILVVGPAEQTRTWPQDGRLDLAAYAPALARGPLPDGIRPALPLALGLGALLLDEAGYAGNRGMLSVAQSASPQECADRGRMLAGLGSLAGLHQLSGKIPVPAGPGEPGPPPGRPPQGTSGRPVPLGLLVMGDGTARRSTSAPGYLDERAEPFDAEVERAVRDGDLPALARLDPDLAADLLAVGRPAWQVLAGALGDAGEVTTEVLYCAAPLGVAYLVATLIPRP